MEQYLFHGVVLPERAQLSLNFVCEFRQPVSEYKGVASVSILLNQVAVWVEVESSLDIFDLRNIVKNIVYTNLSIVGYIRGYAYDVEIIRVINKALGVDYVYGVEIPCLAERNKSVDLPVAFQKVLSKIHGEGSVFLHRCFNDLVSAMKNAEDTGFYCYRAIESLYQHCIVVNGMSSGNKKQQWEKFRAVAECDEQTLLLIKVAADPLRHGVPVFVSSEDRAKLFTSTWDVVGKYIENV